MPIYTYLIKIWPKIYAPDAIRNVKKTEMKEIRAFFDKMYEEKGKDHGILSYQVLIRYPTLEVVFSIEEKITDTGGEFVGFIVDPDRAGEHPVRETEEGKTFYGGFIMGEPVLLSID